MSFRSSPPRAEARNLWFAPLAPQTRYTVDVVAGPLPIDGRSYRATASTALLSIFTARDDRAEAPAPRYPHKRSVQLTVQGLVAVTGVGRFCRRWLAEAARPIIEGRSSRIGASTSQATLRNCSNAAMSYSAAVSNRSMYPLSNLVDSGGVPWISGRERSPPAASLRHPPVA